MINNKANSPFSVPRPIQTSKMDINQIFANFETIVSGFNLLRIKTHTALKRYNVIANTHNNNTRKMQIHLCDGTCTRPLRGVFFTLIVRCSCLA